jgi:hypothetical protein
MAVSLKEVEAMVDALGPMDQMRLLEFLLPRLTEAVIAHVPAGSDAATAWREFRRVGERLAASSNGQSITQAVSDMRR